MYDAFASSFLLNALLRQLAEGAAEAGARDAFTALPAREQQAAIEAEVDASVAALINGGWCPLDLLEFGRRRGVDPAPAYLLEVAARQTAAHPATRIHPRWRAQLDQLGAIPARPLAEWQADLPWPVLAERLVGLLAALCTAPVIHPVLPAPGRVPSGGNVAEGIDAKVLRRVRALLSKAESTDFDDEAEVLSAKAQSLMRQYSIDRTLAQARTEQSATPAARRLWLDSPYVVAKALLVAEVAGANHCRCAITETLGFVTVLGHETDLNVVELLTTSLLLQATRSMRLAGTQLARSGTSRTRSFRQSFLVAYADRIGERLRNSAETTEAATDAEHHGSLLPVLAAHDRQVHDAFAAAFPHLTERGVRVSNAAGWGAGRAAADLALFDIRQSLSGEVIAAKTVVGRR